MFPLSTNGWNNEGGTVVVDSPKRSGRRDPAVRFIIALGVLVLGIGLISLFFELLGAWFYVSVFLTVLVAAGFFWGSRLYVGGEGSSPVLGGAVITLSCVLLFLDVMSVNRMFGAPLPSFSYVLLLTSILAFILAYVLDIAIVLAVGILFFFGWLAYLGGGFWGWLPFFKGGLNSHTFIAAASPFVIASGFLHERLSAAKVKRFSDFAPVYYFMGFLFLNTSLWMLSLFGREARLFGGASGSLEIVVFTILFFIANVAAVVFGGLRKERSYIALGVIFLTINVLTRFGDVFIPGLGRSATFIIAGAIVIAIGLILERLLKKKSLFGSK
jgi:hypothetical protein